MTCFELHLLFNQRYQEIASKKRDKLFPQEVDSFLNKAQSRELQKLVAIAMQDDQASLQAIAALITKNKQLQVIKPDTSDPIYDDLIDYAVLPHNLAYLINSRFTTVANKYDCDNAPNITTITRNEWTAAVHFPSSASAPYYSNFTISSTSGNIYTVPSPYSAGFSNPNSKFLLIQAALDYFNRSNTTLSVYWERYRDTYYKDSFIFVSPTDLGTITVSVTGDSQAVAMTNNTFSVYDHSQISTMPNIVVRQKSYHPTESTQLYQMRDLNKFYAPGAGEPLVEQTEDYLITHRSESFLVTRMIIDYVRKPRHINLDLNQSCEFGSDEVQGKIVDLAVELARLDTMNQSYQHTVQDTELRNKI
jgi:hypothetical protein